MVGSGGNNNNNNNNKLYSPWKLTVSLFAYRLSFECLTDHSLRTVMAVLDTEMDTDIDTILRPLVPSPAMGSIVFGKDPTTRVVVVDGMGDENGNEVALDVDKDDNT